MRSLRVTVLENDFAPTASVRRLRARAVVVRGRGDRVIAETVTGETGRVAFATPADLADREIVIQIEHPDFNWRTLRADGTPLSDACAADIRRTLYPGA